MTPTEEEPVVEDVALGDDEEESYLQAVHADADALLANDELQPLYDRLKNRANIDAEDLLRDFDWLYLLRLIPYIAEHVDTLRGLSGAQKERKALALLTAIAKLAEHGDLVDADAVAVLRLIIAEVISATRGEFALNQGLLRRGFKVAGHALSWTLRHLPCIKRGGD